MQITLDNKTFDLEILRKPNKNLYIRFLDAHTIIVTCNKWVSEKEIKKIIEKNKTSLLKMAAKAEDTQPPPSISEATLAVDTGTTNS